MKVTLENTTKIVELEMPGAAKKMPARIWEGTTESGVRVVAFITRIAVEATQDQAQFERELQSTREPSAPARAIDMRLIL